MSTSVESSPPGSAEVEPSFNRWLIPLAAVLIHVCIGSIYSWSVFNRPINALFPHPLAGWFQAPYITFSTGIVLTGLSSALGGPWVERVGPRAASLIGAVLFGSGLILGGAGVLVHQQLLLWIGMGMVSGIGAGISYIAPIGTLVKWFPDRRGMATGMAVMGFGGGAFIASFLNQAFIDSMGVGRSLLTLGAIYFIVMCLGALLIRRAPVNYLPSGYVPKTIPSQLTAGESISRNGALRTPQFYLLWIMFIINITAGVGILAQASPMMQDMFGKTAKEATAVVAIISIFNALGRFFWATVSDYIGRRPTFLVFLLAQSCLFLLIPRLGAHGEWIPFEIALFAVFTMYGGGLATMPAFAADMFGPLHVGEIYGVLLTAWSVAAVAGPLIITQLSTMARQSLFPGQSKIHIYDQPLTVLAGMLALGFLLCLLIRPLKKRSSLAA